MLHPAVSIVAGVWAEAAKVLQPGTTERAGSAAATIAHRRPAGPGGRGPRSAHRPGPVAGALRRDIATGAGASCSSTERAGPATRGGSCASCGSCGSSGGSGGCSFGTRRVENGAHALAPYLVGEWNDELKLALVDGSALSTTAGAGVVGRRDGVLGCSRE